jgi:uncharacterized protein (TIRG00374 family)
VRRVVALAVLLAVFGFALPRLADYGDAWRAITSMTSAEIAVLSVAGLWNLFTYWPVLVLAQPGLRLREAAVVNQASTAVANTVPAGAAVGVGVTFRMLRAWGFTTESISNETVLTGVWNQLVKLGMPLLGVVAVVATGEVEESFLQLLAWGVGGIAVIVLLTAGVLRTPKLTHQVGAALDRLVSACLVRIGRPRTTAIGPWVERARMQMNAVLRERWLALSVATTVSHLSLYLVLLVAIRVMGVSPDALSWSKVLVGFALVRLLSSIPVTPGGVGVVELGYVGFFSSGAPDGLESSIAAAVLVFRAITYLLPVALGAFAWMSFLRLDSWRRPPDTRGIVA